MSKVRMSIAIDPKIRKMLDALTVQTMMTGTREGYSLLIEKAVQEYFEKCGEVYAKEYVENPENKPFK